MNNFHLRTSLELLFSYSTLVLSTFFVRLLIISYATFTFDPVFGRRPLAPDWPGTLFGFDLYCCRAWTLNVEHPELLVVNQENNKRIHTKRIMPVDVTKLRFHPWSFFYFWLKLKVTLVRAVIYIPTILTIRKQIAKSPKGVSRKAIRVPSRDNGRTILVYRFDSTSSSHKGPRPVHINMHGYVYTFQTDRLLLIELSRSGFVIPFLGTDSEFCGRVAQGTGAIVLVRILSTKLIIAYRCTGL